MGECMPPRKYRLTSNAGSRRPLLGKSPAIAISAAILLMVVAGFANAQTAPRAKPNQIQFEYGAPKDPVYQAIHDQMKEGRALENLQQLLSPLRLPYPLTLKVSGCDGVANAWYDDEVITVCYELLAAILQHAAAQDLPAGVTKADTILGPALDVFLHETGHAVRSEEHTSELQSQFHLV